MVNKPKNWAEAGFVTAEAVLTPRLIMGLSGMEKTGKDHFAFTAPGPMAFLSLDFGDEGVIEKFIPKKQIFKREFKVPKAINSKNRSEMQEQAEAVWEDFKKCYLFSLTNARTVIVDTETESWELCRLAAFGKIEQVKPHHYGPVNREYKEVMIKSAYESNANVIFIQRLKKEYANDKFTGNYEQSGYTNLAYEVQVNVRTYIDPNTQQFCLYVDNCRQNAALRNQTLPALEEGAFAMLAAMVLPTVPAQFWQ